MPQKCAHPNSQNLEWQTRVCRYDSVIAMEGHPALSSQAQRNHEVFTDERKKQEKQNRTTCDVGNTDQNNEIAGALSRGIKQKERKSQGNYF